MYLWLCLVFDNYLLNVQSQGRETKSKNLDCWPRPGEVRRNYVALLPSYGASEGMCPLCFLCVCACADILFITYYYYLLHITYYVQDTSYFVHNYKFNMTSSEKEREMMYQIPVTLCTIINST